MGTTGSIEEDRVVFISSKVAKRMANLDVRQPLFGDSKHNGPEGLLPLIYLKDFKNFGGRIFKVHEVLSRTSSGLIVSFSTKECERF